MSTELSALAQLAGLERELQVYETSAAYPLLELMHPRFQDAYALLSCQWAQWIARWDCRLALIGDQVHLAFPLPIEQAAAASLFDELKAIEELLL